MKSFLFSCLILTVFFYLTAFTPKTPTQHNLNYASTDSLNAQLKFDTTYLNCDTIDEGTIYKFLYHYTNVGSDTLYLINVKSSCGCYVPRWNPGPIPPGARGTIEGTYNSRGRPGRFTKTMTIRSTEPIKPTQFLTCKGYVKQK